jgi:hypothetical protein
VELPQIKKEKEVKTMAYPKKIDDEKLKELVDDGKCDQEIAEFFNVNKMSVYNNRRKLGLYGPRSYKKKPSNVVEKPENQVGKQETRPAPVKPLIKISALDILIVERDKLNKAIEILSA